MAKLHRKKGYLGRDGKFHRSEERACIRCNKIYYAINDYEKRKQKYCSKNCWKTAKTIFNKCKWCNKEIKTYISVNKQYCGNECRNNDYAKIKKGSNSHFWKGGKTKELKIIRSSANYKNWRLNVFRRDNFICQICKKTGVYLHADHVKPFAYYPELRFELSNGRTLCKKCHKKTNTYGNGAKFCDVAVKRWEKLTNIKGIKI